MLIWIKQAQCIYQMKRRSSGGFKWENLELTTFLQKRKKKIILATSFKHQMQMEVTRVTPLPTGALLWSYEWLQDGHVLITSQARAEVAPFFLFLDPFKNTRHYLLNINGVQVVHRLMRVLFWWITKGWCLMHKTGCSLLGGEGGFAVVSGVYVGRCWKLPWTRNRSWMCNTLAMAREEEGFRFNTTSRK